MNDFESPLEEDFEHFLLKWLHKDTMLHRQFPCEPYRIDFAMGRNDRVVGIELDGEEFHTDQGKDSVRDRAIIRAGSVNRIVRVSGRTHYNSYYETQAALCGLEREMFNCNVEERLKLYIERRRDRDPVKWSPDRYGYACVSWWFRVGDDSRLRAGELRYMDRETLDAAGR